MKRVHVWILAAATLGGVLVYAVERATAEHHPKFRAVAAEVASGERISASFDRPIQGRATNQYWMALSRRGSGDHEYQKARYVPRLALGESIEATEPGEYELRLHANHPVEPFHVVDRVPVRIVPRSEAHTP